MVGLRWNQVVRVYSKGCSKVNRHKANLVLNQFLLRLLLLLYLSTE